MTNGWMTPEHVGAYLARMKNIPHRVEGESTLLSELPQKVKGCPTTAAVRGICLGKRLEQGALSIEAQRQHSSKTRW